MTTTESNIYLITAEFGLNGKGSAVVQANEKSTCLNLGFVPLYLDTKPLGQKVDVYIRFDGAKFPNVRKPDDIVMFITYIETNQIETFPGQIIDIRKEE